MQVLTIMNRGGAETMIMNYYRAMDKTKIQFDFLLHRTAEGAFDKEIVSLGGKIYYMPAINPKNYFQYKKRLEYFFKQHKEYQIVHSHLNALSTIILGVAKKNGVRVRIAHSHLAVEPYVIANIFRKNTDVMATIKDAIQSLIKFKVADNATHFFACSLKAGEWLFGKKQSENIKVINNAINTSNFTYDSQLAVKAKKNLHLLDKKIIGHVGRFNEQKNHFFLIKIVKELIELDKDFNLVLIGDGNLKPSIENEVQKLNIKDHVHFLGLQDNIPFYLQAFDIFLFPSLYEGLPVTLIEAQAAGLKIITSSTVTKEVNITDLVTFYDLDKSEKEWAKLVLNTIDYTRENTMQTIIEMNYDIVENANKLQMFYLQNN
ncbi:glycosyltransferase family 1 protein [Yeosuana sp. AK3]